MSKNKKRKSYVRWPLYMIILLAVMAGLICAIDRRAGYVAFVTVLLYAFVAVLAWLRGRPAARREMVSFATHYGQIQKRLLKELPVPYALLGLDGRVLWSNTEFRNITGKSLKRGRPISSVFHEINSSVFPAPENPVVTLTLSFEERDYRAELKLIDLSGDADDEEESLESDFEGQLVALYLFETTEINRYIRENREQRMVAGLVYIDNYDETLENVEEIRTSLLVVLIERKINKYFNAYDGIVRKLEKDRFFVVMQEKALDQIRENKFDLLQDIKTVNIGNEMAMTLSISIGSGGATYMDCMEYARSAMDLALARGGDQAVVKTKDQITYYGGKTQQMEKNTRVKARVKAQAFRELVETKDSVVVMGHQLTDMDSFGAAVGIYRAAQTLNKKAHIVINQISTSVKPMLEIFEESIGREQGVVIGSAQAQEIVDKNTVVVVVDTNRPSYT
ncbi:MAG: DHH family phosphoesterase, partial [Lachnospiraceae bacterium]|nr:DHH family phosphoesterase [Lachnospiraceae bacterium]